MPGSRTPKKKRSKATPRKTAGTKPKSVTSELVARVNSQVALEIYANGKVGVYVEGEAIELGHISPGTVKRAQGLREGLPVASFSPAKTQGDQEVEAVARRLARSGLLEFRLTAPRGKEMVAIEPQIAG